VKFLKKANLNSKSKIKTTRLKKIENKIKNKKLESAAKKKKELKIKDIYDLVILHRCICIVNLAGMKQCLPLCASVHRK
jgi:hypothetical protein